MVDSFCVFPREISEGTGFVFSMENQGYHISEKIFPTRSMKQPGENLRLRRVIADLIVNFPSSYFNALIPIFENRIFFQGFPAMFFMLENRDLFHDFRFGTRNSEFCWKPLGKHRNSTLYYIYICRYDFGRFLFPIRGFPN